MEAYQQDTYLRTFSLSVDEPNLSYTRQGLEHTFRAGDQMIVELTDSPRPGGLVLVDFENQVRLCRFESIHGNDFLFPPVNVPPSLYKKVIIGQVIEHVRIQQWFANP